MPFNLKIRGFTLFELVTVIAVISIIVVISTPFFTSLLRSYEANQVFSQLYPPLSDARNKAASLHYSVGLCGSSDQISCDNNWNAGVLLFSDQNSDRILQNTEQVLNYYPIQLKYGTLSWRGAGLPVSNVLLYDADRGRLNMSNGSFKYCAEQSQWYRMVILPKFGQPRQSKDSNNDGIHETASGSNISC